MRSRGSGPVLIGIDVGTSSVKGVLAGPGGERLDTYAGTHAMDRSGHGVAEQDPSDWLAHVEAALAGFAAHPDAGAVAAIGVTSQVNTHVFCDARLRPLHPAITWQDTRAAAAGARLDAAISPEAKIEALGAPIPIDASHALSRMAWMAGTHPDLWAATAHVMTPKDWIIARLTGEVAADPLASVGLVGPDLRYAPGILALDARAADLLPPLGDPLEIAGRVAKQHPFAGTPVAVGTMDAWASMFGLGVATEGQAFYLSGTSEVLGVISRTRAGSPGIITFPDWRGITLHAGPTQSGGASLAWVSRLLGKEVPVLCSLAADVRIRRQSPLFLPHLEGERAPLWDPASRGAFSGLSSVSGPAELAAAVMEGVAFGARLAFESVEASGKTRVDHLRHGGGGAVADVWCQIRANAFGRRFDRVAAPDAGATGALVMAGVAAGLGDLGQATQSLVAMERGFDPDPDAFAVAEHRFGAFQELYRVLGSVTARLTDEPEGIAGMSRQAGT